ncbi:MAG: tRNA (N(6)-L-threonylcarbamoyladenosine(37)-C(2))-methylthiotransferase MtaB [Candidatus Marinimicrobia bacterium]|nr:tRNA (N(6)-L-threonylcarbamoyladenosine(37)-C(2))-methylthiotransferase MtaB [Candidatus Neomarinimicrobiota bacterium]
MSSPYKTVAFQTLGCKLNFTETSTLAREFSTHGYAQVNANDPADLVVINTCSVTENANKKARKAVRQALKRSPQAQVAVIGCYAQLNPEEIIHIPGVRLVAGAEDKFKIVEAIESGWNEDKAVVLNSPIQEVENFVPSYSMGERTRSFLKVQDGCDYTCSFCTIPLARGKSRSANIENTLLQAQDIADSGMQEIVLTGVNVGDFGKNHGETFYDLIRELEKLQGIERYRISSIEPNLLTDDIIRFIFDSQKFLPHFHIPLQSGSDTILKSMRRRYQRNLYAEKVSYIKAMDKQACIGVDVIVGFPGETEKDFAETYDFLNGLDVSYLHVFSYSQRRNTDAVALEPKIPTEVIAERSRILQKLSMEKRKSFYTQNLQSSRKVLAETWETGFLTGHTENYIPVHIKGEKAEVNSIIPVKLIHLSDSFVMGERHS